MSPTTSFHAVLGQPRDVGGVARVGELVEHGDVHLGVVVYDVVHEVAADEAAAARDDDVVRDEGVISHGNLHHSPFSPNLRRNTDIEPLSQLGNLYFTRASPRDRTLPS